MKYLTINLILLVILCILSGSIWNAMAFKQDLQEKIGTNKKADVKYRQINPASEQAMIDGKTVIPLKDLSEEIVRQKEIRQVLVHAQHDLLLREALNEAGFGCGYMGVIISKSDCEAYWHFYAEQAQFVLQSYQRLEAFVNFLPLEQLPSDEQDFLRQYLAYRKKWSEIIYDTKPSIDEKINVYTELNQMQPRFYDIVSNLSKAIGNSKLMEDYQNLKEALHIATSEIDNIVGWHYYTYNGTPYRIYVPEEPFFDDTISSDAIIID